MKHYYGVLERQFRGYYKRAVKGKGNTGEALMSLLERRLDNVVCRLGFGLSRAQARQLIRHGHITVNGRRCDIPSYLVHVGDVIRVKNRGKSLQAVQACLAEAHRDVPDFLSRIEGGHSRRARQSFADRGRLFVGRHSSEFDRRVVFEVKVSMCLRV